HELHRPLDPRPQLVVVLDAFRLDRHPIPHRPAGDVEPPDVRLPQRRFPLVGAEAGDEPVLPDPGECVAMEEEADAAEHLLLLDILAPGQCVTDADGEGFIEGHLVFLNANLEKFRVRPLSRRRWLARLETVWAVPRSRGEDGPRATLAALGTE